MKKSTCASINDVIQWQDAKTEKFFIGTVFKVLENSVLVNMPNTNEKTVVSHKRYTVISPVSK